MDLESIHRFVAKQTGDEEVLIEVLTDDLSRFLKSWQENLKILLYLIASPTQLILIPRLEQSIQAAEALSTQA